MKNDFASSLAFQHETLGMKQFFFFFLFIAHQLYGMQATRKISLHIKMCLIITQELQI